MNDNPYKVTSGEEYHNAYHQEKYHDGCSYCATEIRCEGCDRIAGGDWNGEDDPVYCLDCQISSAEDEAYYYYNQDGRN